MIENKAIGLKSPINKRYKESETIGLEGVKNALKHLKKHLPLFKKNLPLELSCFNKVHDKISEIKGSERFSKKIYRKAISRHTGSIDYLKKCLVVKYRYNLELKESSELTAEEYLYFEEKLKETEVRVEAFHLEFMKTKKSNKKKKERPIMTKKMISRKKPIENVKQEPKKFSFK